MRSAIGPTGPHELRTFRTFHARVFQYLAPSPQHLPVERFVPPEEFDEIGDLVRSLGFTMVASGPFVRSSYHAGEMAEEQKQTAAAHG